ncbi:hypothetical protein [Hydrogenivirga sp. 128-5-R1-1]|uniref:hypothetical protein n=1 Tax=Hydrogenivirga sp. 128-5-R1-1 TaxID=392423 RepID=UPI00015EF52D|nr:hypothetical protein [Hydrogenivirga sp. 128-5-R1-1]EDP74151.1 hypothetical protein HG1285_07522 [Hydrogenivirga sp. 128-5-R1-1]
MKNVANELGKTFFNIAVAIVVFMLLQPFVKGELSFKLIVITVMGFTISLFIGAVLLYFAGGKKDEC